MSKCLDYWSVCITSKRDLKSRTGVLSMKRLKADILTIKYLKLILYISVDEVKLPKPTSCLSYSWRNLYKQSSGNFNSPKPLFSFLCNCNQLDEVFVISGIIKVSASVISLGLGWLHLPWPWLFQISQKPNSLIVLLYIVLWKICKNYCVKCKSILFVLLKIQGHMHQVATSLKTIQVLLLFSLRCITHVHCTWYNLQV